MVRWTIALPSAQHALHISTANRQWVKEQLKAEMYLTGFSNEASDRVKIEQDPEVLKAAESMPKAKALLDSAKKQLVQRLTQQKNAE